MSDTSRTPVCGTKRFRTPDGHRAYQQLSRPQASVCKLVHLLKLSGERAGNRTPNLVIKSHLLCQLSYAPGKIGARFGMAIGAAKAALNDKSLYHLHFEKAFAKLAETAGAKGYAWRSSPRNPRSGGSGRYKNADAIIAA